ncbi:MAG: hypothetical protein LUO84_02765 [Methanomassiliicoccales archaeon]|nr:hypothetical protein [Methanomassiliicoccales archaeon]
MIRRSTHPRIIEMNEINDGRVVVTMVYVVSEDVAKMMMKAEARNELHVGIPLSYYEEFKGQSRRGRKGSKKPRNRTRRKGIDTDRQVIDGRI